MRTSLLAAATLFWIGSGGAPSLAAPAAETKPAPCSAPEYRSLDFWVGDWDAYDVEDLKTPAARARVDVILGGCALREIYEGNNGVVGQSFTAYDAGRKLWHQTWVTNRGKLLTIEGRFEGNSLTLEGPQSSPDGGKELLRGLWRPQDGGVREVAHSSSDAGATWKPLFDILFLPHKGGAGGAIPSARPTPWRFPGAASSHPERVALPAYGR